MLKLCKTAKHPISATEHFEDFPSLPGGVFCWPPSNWGGSFCKNFEVLADTGDGKSSQNWDIKFWTSKTFPTFKTLRRLLPKKWGGSTHEKNDSVYARIKRFGLRADFEAFLALLIRVYNVNTQTWGESRLLQTNDWKTKGWEQDAHSKLNQKNLMNLPNDKVLEVHSFQF